MYMFFIKIPHFIFRNIYNVRRENKQIKNKEEIMHYEQWMNA